jgi:hypothetical protein
MRGGFVFAQRWVPIRGGFLLSAHSRERSGDLVDSADAAPAGMARSYLLDTYVRSDSGLSSVLLSRAE